MRGVRLRMHPQRRNSDLYRESCLRTVRPALRGERLLTNHTGQEAWVTTAESHTKVYSCCKAVIQQSAAHTWNDEGRCSVCGYGCTHSGGTATCTQQAVCEICGALYGDPDPGNHTPSEVWTQENGKHYHVCLNGCETHLDEEACSGGTAACTAKAVCQSMRPALWGSGPG